MFDYGNVERVLWDSATAQGGNMTYLTGSKALKAGQIVLFWPLSADGATGHEQPVVEYRVRLSNGNQVSAATLGDISVNGITVALGDFTTRGYKSERFATVANTGALGILDISVILKAYPNESGAGIMDRLYAIEQELGGSTGPSNDPRFTVGVAVADPAATTSTALANPADNADAAALVAWAKTVVTNFNAVRTTNSNVRTSVIALITSLENGGFITK